MRKSFIPLVRFITHDKVVRLEPLPVSSHNSVTTEKDCEMSDTAPSSAGTLTPIDIALLLPVPGSSFAAGYAEIPISVMNSDGTEPSVVYSDSGLSAPAVTFAFVAAGSGGVLTVTAASSGTGTLTVSADGVPQIEIVAAVSVAPFESLTAGTPTIVPPGPSTGSSTAAAPVTAPLPANVPPFTGHS